MENVKEGLRGSNFLSINKVLSVLLPAKEKKGRRGVTSMKLQKKQLKKSAHVWNKAKIPVKGGRKAIKRPKKLVIVWENLKKNKKRQVETFKK